MPSLASLTLIMRYACQIWGEIQSKTFIDMIQHIQNKA